VIPAISGWTARVFACTAAALIMGASTGCLRRETPVEAGIRTQVLHRGLGADLSDLDPHLATQTADYSVLSALFEGLVAEDPIDLHPVPGLAQSWDVSPDGLVYTFRIRPDARWTDGRPLTAMDFVESWRRVLTPSLGAENANLLFVIEGAEAYNRRAAGFSQVGLSAPDTRTLRVALERPAAYFLSMLSSPAWLPVPLATIAKYGDPVRRGDPWARPGRIVSNGPFVLESWKAGQEIVVRRSDTYWDRANVHLSAIHFHAIDSLDAEERAFRAGQLHVTEALPPAKLDAYRRDNPRVLRIDPLLGTYFYRLNVKRPGLADPRIRRALGLAIDRVTLVDRILHGQIPASSFTPAGLGAYQPGAGQDYDPAAARSLLAAAGHASGRGLPVYELLYNNSETHRLVAEALQEMWRRELGVRIRLVNEDPMSVLDARRTGAYDILRSSWIADYADPSAALELWRSDSGNNFTGWSSVEYDGQLFTAARTQDPGARNAQYALAEHELLVSAPILPIYHYTHVFLLAPSVRGWHPTLLDHHPYKAVSLEGP